MEMLWDKLSRSHRQRFQDYIAAGQPAVPVMEQFEAVWDRMSGGERLTVAERVTSDEWRMSRPRQPAAHSVIPLTGET
jgi:hypothetical protein